MAQYIGELIRTLRVPVTDIADNPVSHVASQPRLDAGLRKLFFAPPAAGEEAAARDTTNSKVSTQQSLLHAKARAFELLLKNSVHLRGLQRTDKVQIVYNRSPVKPRSGDRASGTRGSPLFEESESVDGFVDGDTICAETTDDMLYARILDISQAEHGTQDFVEQSMSSRTRHLSRRAARLQELGNVCLSDKSQRLSACLRFLLLISQQQTSIQLANDVYDGDAIITTSLDRVRRQLFATMNKDSQTLPILSMPSITFNETDTPSYLSDASLDRQCTLFGEQGAQLLMRARGDTNMPENPAIPHATPSLQKKLSLSREQTPLKDATSDDSGNTSASSASEAPGLRHVRAIHNACIAIGRQPFLLRQRQEKGQAHTSRMGQAEQGEDAEKDETNDQPRALILKLSHLSSAARTLQRMTDDDCFKASNLSMSTRLQQLCATCLAAAGKIADVTGPLLLDHRHSTSPSILKDASVFVTHFAAWLLSWDSMLGSLLNVLIKEEHSLLTGKALLDGTYRACCSFDTVFRKDESGRDATVAFGDVSVDFPPTIKTFCRDSFAALFQCFLASISDTLLLTPTQGSPTTSFTVPLCLASAIRQSETQNLIADVKLLSTFGKSFIPKLEAQASTLLPGLPVDDADFAQSTVLASYQCYRYRTHSSVWISSVAAADMGCAGVDAPIGAACGICTLRDLAALHPALAGNGELHFLVRCMCFEHTCSKASFPLASAELVHQKMRIEDDDASSHTAGLDAFESPADEKHKKAAAIRMARAEQDAQLRVQQQQRQAAQQAILDDLMLQAENAVKARKAAAAAEKAENARELDAMLPRSPQSKQLTEAARKKMLEVYGAKLIALTGMSGVEGSSPEEIALQALADLGPQGRLLAESLSPAGPGRRAGDESAAAPGITSKRIMQAPGGNSSINFADGPTTSRPSVVVSHPDSDGTIHSTGAGGSDTGANMRAHVVVSQPPGGHSSLQLGSDAPPEGTGTGRTGVPLVVASDESESVAHTVVSQPPGGHSTLQLGHDFGAQELRHVVVSQPPGGRSSIVLGTDPTEYPLPRAVLAAEPMRAEASILIVPEAAVVSEAATPTRDEDAAPPGASEMPVQPPPSAFVAGKETAIILATPQKSASKVVDIPYTAERAIVKPRGVTPRELIQPVPERASPAYNVSASFHAVFQQTVAAALRERRAIIARAAWLLLVAQDDVYAHLRSLRQWMLMGDDQTFNTVCENLFPADITATSTCTLSVRARGCLRAAQESIGLYQQHQLLNEQISHDFRQISDAIASRSPSEHVTHGSSYAVSLGPEVAFDIARQARMRLGCDASVALMHCFSYAHPSNDETAPSSTSWWASGWADGLQPLYSFEDAMNAQRLQFHASHAMHVHPLSELFPESAMTRYACLHRLLFKLKRTSFELRRLWQLLMKWPRRQRNPAVFLACLFRHEAHLFVSSMEDYIKSKVLDDGYRELIVRLAGVSCTREAATAHDDYLRSLLAKCLLPDPSSTFSDPASTRHQSGLIAASKLLELLLTSVLNFCHAFYAQVAGDSSIQAGAIVKLQAAHGQFRRHFATAYRVLVQMCGAGGGFAHIEDFVARLRSNDFFDQLL
jgi:hypothetical protein